MSGLRSGIGREFRKRGAAAAKFCRSNCRVFVAPRKSERQLTAGQRLANQARHFELDTLSNGVKKYNRKIEHLPT